MEKVYHKAVLLDESLTGLNIKPEGTYVDVTFGGGGHSRAIIAQLGENGKLFAFDQDADAAANTINDRRFKLLHENFSHLKAFLRLEGIRSVDGIIADLGISSHQIDEAERGFSTRLEGKLDMRMDNRNGITAADIVNNYEESELRSLMKMYGELPNASQIAKSICDSRKNSAITSTSELCEAVKKHLPRGFENKYLAMIFQALRIEVNGELDALKALLQQTAEILKPSGRLVVISYHSLEDRLVKNFMKAGNFEGTIKKDFYGNPVAPLKMVCRKVITPSESELQENNRSRSAKLRIAERTETNIEK